MPERTSIRSMWNKCPQQQKTTQFMSLVNKTSRSISSVQIMVFYEVISFIKVKEIRIKCIWHPKMINPLNAELNPICHLLPLLWAHHILHVSRIRVKWKKKSYSTFIKNVGSVSVTSCSCISNTGFSQWSLVHSSWRAETGFFSDNPRLRQCNSPIMEETPSTRGKNIFVHQPAHWYNDIQHLKSYQNICEFWGF